MTRNQQQTLGVSVLQSSTVSQILEKTYFLILCSPGITGQVTAVPRLWVACFRAKLRLPRLHKQALLVQLQDSPQASRGLSATSLCPPGVTRGRIFTTLEAETPCPRTWR